MAAAATTGGLSGRGLRTVRSVARGLRQRRRCGAGPSPRLYSCPAANARAQVSPTRVASRWAITSSGGQQLLEVSDGSIAGWQFWDLAVRRSRFIVSSPERPLCSRLCRRRLEYSLLAQQGYHSTNSKTYHKTIGRSNPKPSRPWARAARWGAASFPSPSLLTFVDPYARPLASQSHPSSPKRRQRRRLRGRYTPFFRGAMIPPLKAQAVQSMYFN